jgi:E3 ubiquitin-protein ligase TRIP12
MDDDDMNMLEPEYTALAQQPSSAPAKDEAEKDGAGGEHEEGNSSDVGGAGGDDDDGAPASGGNGLGSDPAGAGMDDAAAMAAIFGDFRQFGSYMLGMSSRLKSMLDNIKMTADPTTRLMTLQELSEILSMSTEDTLAGSFPVEGYIRELVRILGGSGKYEDDDEGDGDDDMHDEDAQLAAALAMSNGGSTFNGDENLEAQVLACRCLANLMEAMPGVAHTIVYHGALPVLCSKLIEISYIDLAEQTLSVCPCHCL